MFWIKLWILKWWVNDHLLKSKLLISSILNQWWIFHQTFKPHILNLEVCENIKWENTKLTSTSRWKVALWGEAHEEVWEWSCVALWWLASEQVTLSRLYCFKAAHFRLHKFKIIACFIFVKIIKIIVLFF